MNSGAIFAWVNMGKMVSMARDMTVLEKCWMCTDHEQGPVSIEGPSYRIWVFPF